MVQTGIMNAPTGGGGGGGGIPQLPPPPPPPLAPRPAPPRRCPTPLNHCLPAAALLDLAVNKTTFDERRDLVRMQQAAYCRCALAAPRSMGPLAPNRPKPPAAQYAAPQRSQRQASLLLMPCRRPCPWHGPSLSARPAPAAVPAQLGYPKPPPPPPPPAGAGSTRTGPSTTSRECGSATPRCSCTPARSAGSCAPPPAQRTARLPPSPARRGLAAARHPTPHTHPPASLPSTPRVSGCTPPHTPHPPACLPAGHRQRLHQER